MVRSLRISRELGLRKTREWIGDSGSGGVRSAYHGGNGEDGAGLRWATGLNPRDPQRRRGGGARRRGSESDRELGGRKARSKGSEKTEKRTDR